MLIAGPVGRVSSTMIAVDPLAPGTMALCVIGRLVHKQHTVTWAVTCHERLGVDPICHASCRCPGSFAAVCFNDKVLKRSGARVAKHQWICFYGTHVFPQACLLHNVSAVGRIAGASAVVPANTTLSSAVRCKDDLVDGGVLFSAFYSHRVFVVYSAAEHWIVARR